VNFELPEKKHISEAFLLMPEREGVQGKLNASCASKRCLKTIVITPSIILKLEP